MNKSPKLETKYKCYKNKLTSILRFCEKENYKHVLEKYRGDIKATWNVLNDIINRKAV